MIQVLRIIKSCQTKIQCNVYDRTVSKTILRWNDKLFNLAFRAPFRVVIFFRNWISWVFPRFPREISNPPLRKSRWENSAFLMVNWLGTIVTAYLFLFWVGSPVSFPQEIQLSPSIPWDFHKNSNSPTFPDFSGFPGWWPLCHFIQAQPISSCSLRLKLTLMMLINNEGHFTSAKNLVR